MFSAPAFQGNARGYRKSALRAIASSVFLLIARFQNIRVELKAGRRARLWGARADEGRPPRIGLESGDVHLAPFFSNFRAAFTREQQDRDGPCNGHSEHNTHRRRVAPEHFAEL